jgi:hypothetical protein
MTVNPSTFPSRRPADDRLPTLEPSVIERIEQALARVGDFGEIGLVIVKGEIKYIRITSSEGLTERPGM